MKKIVPGVVLSIVILQGCATATVSQQNTAAPTQEVSTASLAITQSSSQAEADYPRLYPDCSGQNNSMDMFWQPGDFQIVVDAQHVDYANVKLYKTDEQTMKKNLTIGAMARCDLVSEDKLGSKPFLTGKLKISSQGDTKNPSHSYFMLEGIQAPGVYYLAMSIDGVEGSSSGLFLNVTDSEKNYANRQKVPHYDLPQFVSKKFGFGFDYPAKAFDPATNKMVNVEVYERDNQVVVARTGLNTDADFAVNTHDMPGYKGMAFLNSNPSWVMNVAQNVKTEADLQKIVQARYGEACTFSLFTSPVGKNVMEISQISDGLGPDENTKCWPNWKYYFYWNQATGVAVYWDGGQEAQFWKGTATGGQEGAEAYDETMVQSFHFND